MTDSLNKATVTISDTAVQRLQILTKDGEFKGMHMRVSVSGGGCSGFQYGFTFDKKNTKEDRLVKNSGVSILIDNMSWDLLVGSELHFVEDLMGSYFTLRNPNAASTCGCGVSFSVG